VIAQSVLMANLSADASSLVMDSTIQAGMAVIAIVAALFQRQRWLQIGAPAAFLVGAVMFYGRLMEP
jgi:hypothetical protein